MAASNVSKGHHKRKKRAEHPSAGNNTNEIVKGFVETKKMTTKDEKDQGKISELEKLNGFQLFGIAIVRILTLAGWIGGIIYSTWHVYLAAEMHLPKLKPGALSRSIGRGRDCSDGEWSCYGFLIWTTLLGSCALWQFLKVTFAQIGLHKAIPWISPVISLLLFKHLIGWATIHMLAVPVIYWVLMRFRQKILIWIATLGLLLHLKSEAVSAFFPDKKDGYYCSLYYFRFASAWNLCKCLSFCMDNWDKPSKQKWSFGSLSRLQQYIWYLPLALNGPIVMFDHFEKEIIKKTKVSEKQGDFVQLGKGLLKLLLITALMEILLYYVYVGPLSFETSIIPKHNFWAIAGSIFWLGQFFALKYKILYGVPSSIAEFDGLSMYPLPACPAHLHRFSVLWKDFDRGQYIFMVRYIYIPLIQKFNRGDRNSRVHIEIKKLLATLGTFIFIFGWHGFRFSTFVWATFNFLGVTIERIGSVLKKEIDATRKLEPIVWDFLIEPIVTIPLAFMSILNSSVFLTTMPSAIAYCNKFIMKWTMEYHYHFWIWVFIYCLTHVGVSVRTLAPFSKVICKRVQLTLSFNSKKK